MEKDLSSFGWDSSSYAQYSRFFQKENTEEETESIEENSSVYDYDFPAEENLEEENEAEEKTSKKTSRISKHSNLQHSNPPVQSQDIHHRFTKENLIESENEFFEMEDLKNSKVFDQQMEYEAEIERNEERYRKLREKLRKNFHELLNKIKEGHP